MRHVNNVKTAADLHVGDQISVWYPTTYSQAMETVIIDSLVYAGEQHVAVYVTTNNGTRQLFIRYDDGQFHRVTHGRVTHVHNHGTTIPAPALFNDNAWDSERAR